ADLKTSYLALAFDPRRKTRVRRRIPKSPNRKIFFWRPEIVQARCGLFAWMCLGGSSHVTQGALSMCKSSILSIVLGAALVAGIFTDQIHASNLNWSNIAGGAASTSGNWSPSQVPTSADDLIFNLLNTYTVT